MVGTSVIKTLLSNTAGTGLLRLRLDGNNRELDTIYGFGIVDAASNP